MHACVRRSLNKINVDENYFLIACAVHSVALRRSAADPSITCTTSRHKKMHATPDTVAARPGSPIYCSRNLPIVARFYPLRHCRLLDFFKTIIATLRSSVTTCLPSLVTRKLQRSQLGHLPIIIAPRNLP